MTQDWYVCVFKLHMAAHTHTERAKYSSVKKFAIKRLLKSLTHAVKVPLQILSIIPLLKTNRAK